VVATSRQPAPVQHQRAAASLAEDGGWVEVARKARVVVDVAHHWAKASHQGVDDPHIPF